MTENIFHFIFYLYTQFDINWNFSNFTKNIFIYKNQGNYKMKIIKQTKI
jgi:hypothetical protein